MLEAPHADGIPIPTPRRSARDAVLTVPWAAVAPEQPELVEPMRIALAQIASGTDPWENLKLVEQYTHAAAQAGSKLVVFRRARCAASGFR